VSSSSATIGGVSPAACAPIVAEAAQVGAQSRDRA
jgi:hypothetical protein